MKFQVGKTYSTRSICDYDSIFSYEVIKRTAKTVTLKYGNQEKTRKVQVDDDNIEYCYPQGKYSMAPRLEAKEGIN